MIVRQPKFRNALDVAVWVIKQPFKYDLKLSLAQILLTVASILMEGSAIAALMLYTNSLDLDTSTATLNIFESALPISLPVLILCILTLLFIGGFFGLLSQLVLSNLASRLEARITMDILTCPVRFNSGALPFRESPRQAHRVLKSIALKRAKFTGRALRVLMQSSADAARVIVFLGLCLYLAPGITFVLCATTAIFLAFQLLLSQKIHSNQIERERIVPKVNREMNEFLTSAYETAHSTNEIASDLASKYQNSRLKLSRALYCQHLNATKYSEFIGNINLATGIAIGAYLVTESFFQGTISLTEVIAYVIAARLLLTSVKSLFGKVGAFSKLFIHAKSVFQFIYAEEANTSIAELKTTNGMHFPQAIISNAHLDRIIAAHFLKQLFPFDQVHEHYAILPGHLIEESVPPFETLTGYSSIADVRSASEAIPAISAVWAVWQAYCDEHSLDSLQQESWLMLASKHPEIVHVFAGIGFEHRDIRFLVVAVSLLRQTPMLLETISALNPSIRIYLYLSERQIPYKTENIELAYILGKNGTVKMESFDWVNKNIHLFSEDLNLDSNAEGYLATEGDLADSEDDDI